jgi:hypothetical protein
LKQDVLAELAWEPSISADHIGVTAKEGVVTLPDMLGAIGRSMRPKAQLVGCRA